MPNPTFVSTFWMYHQFTSKSQKRIVASLALACQEILLQPCCGLYFRPLKQAAALCEATKRDLSSKPASSLAKAASVSVVSVVNSREFWKEEECNHQNLNFNRSWGQTELPDSAMHAGGVSGGGGGYGKKDPLEVRPLLTLKVISKSWKYLGTPVPKCTRYTWHCWSSPVVVSVNDMNSIERMQDAMYNKSRDRWCILDAYCLWFIAF